VGACEYVHLHSEDTDGPLRLGIRAPGPLAVRRAVRICRRFRDGCALPVAGIQYPRGQLSRADGSIKVHAQCSRRLGRSELRLGKARARREALVGVSAVGGVFRVGVLRAVPVQMWPG
jgi:hypothetical protein